MASLIGYYVSRETIQVDFIYMHIYSIVCTGIVFLVANWRDSGDLAVVGCLSFW